MSKTGGSAAAEVSVQDDVIEDEISDQYDEAQQVMEEDHQKQPRSVSEVDDGDVDIYADEYGEADS